MIVDCMTDNKTRTVADVRHVFTKYGGNLGTDGCVAFMFQHCGHFIFAPHVNEDAIMEAVLDAGAQDIQTDEEGLTEVVCEVAKFHAVKTSIEHAKLVPESAEITWKPQSETQLSGDEALKMQKLLDALEDLDDVQNVFTNVIISH